MKEKGANKVKSQKKLFIAAICVVVFCVMLFSFIISKGNLTTAVSSVGTFITNMFNGETEAKRSISMESNESYESKVPGSWHLDKSAEWTAIDKAKITFDVNSVMKQSNNNNKDVLLVLDISGSMNGDKLQKVKDDSTELVESLLSDTNNKVGLIVYDTNAETITGFTNDKDDLVSKINALSDKNMTNYNDPLKHVDSIMENYIKQENRDVVTLFLTDGYPNEDTPNQIATYQMLKSKYPYMAINGIQYEMGATMTQEIIEISDSQFIASMETLENVLFEAAIVPVVYDTFEIEDLINNDYFVVGSIDDIEVTIGEVNLTEENGVQKITWNLNNTNTGANAKMTINVTLKSEYVRQEGNYPTNKGTTVIYKEETNNIQTKETEETPILSWKQYNVIYDANTPQGATVKGVPETEKYYPFDTVTKKRTEPICNEWNFKGWEMITENITNINEDTFIMPAENVTIRAIWGKPNVSKSMEGTVVAAKIPVKYAVQIYGIQEDVDENDNLLGLTFGPAVGADYNNAYVTHKYEPANDGSENYYVKIVKHNVKDEAGRETTTEEYLYKNGETTEKVTRTEEEKNKYDVNIHNMKWNEIKEQSQTDPTVFKDCMLCGDTKSVNLYLNDTIASGTEQTAYGDGAGTIRDEIALRYKQWNPSKSNSNSLYNNSAVGTGVTLDSNEQKYGSNAKKTGGYKVSHIRATLIGKENSNPTIGYAGDENLSKDECLYSCIETNLQNVITAKKVKYVTGSHNSIYQSNNTPLIDKIWLFSHKEVYGTGQYTGGTTEGVGTTGVAYNKFMNTESKYYIGASTGSVSSTNNREAYCKAGSTDRWGLRSPMLYHTYAVEYVSSSGGIYSDYACNNYGLAFGFCL